MIGTPIQEPAQFIVVPLTGIQICRGHILRHLGYEDMAKVWTAARRLGDQPRIRNPLVPLVTDHFAYDRVPPEDSTPWIACTRGGTRLFSIAPCRQ